MLLKIARAFALVMLTWTGTWYLVKLNNQPIISEWQACVSVWRCVCMWGGGVHGGQKRMGDSPGAGLKFNC